MGFHTSSQYYWLVIQLYNAINSSKSPHLERNVLRVMVLALGSNCCKLSPKIMQSNDDFCQTLTQSESERETDRQTDRQTDKQTETHTETERELENFILQVL